MWFFFGVTQSIRLSISVLNVWIASYAYVFFVVNYACAFRRFRAFQFDIWNCNEKSWNINITSQFLRFIYDQRKTKYNNLGASKIFRLFFIHHLITKRMKLNTFCLMNVDTFFMKHFFFALFFPSLMLGFVRQQHTSNKGIRLKLRISHWNYLKIDESNVETL